MRKAALACVSVVFYASPATEARAAQYTVTLPAASLGETLFQISRISGIEFVFASPDAARLRSRPVRGRYDLHALLDAVMEGTRARYRFITPRTVLVSIGPPVKRGAAPPKPPRTGSEPVPNRAIVVTATRREELLTDVPVSSSSYSQAALDLQGLDDMQAIARVTPGMLLRNTWGGSTNLSIRGVYSNTGSATTGVYIDETPIQTRSLGAGVTSTNIYPSVFDLERVEVLRGPQGALFGSGSLGGTIRFITRSPDLERVSASASASTMATRGGEIGYEASAALGAPIIEDRLAYRIAAFARRDGGWNDRVHYGDRTVADRDANRLTSVAVRGALSAKIGEDITVTPSVFYQRWSQRDTSQFWSLLSDTAAGRFRTGARFAQPSRDSFLLSTLKVNAEFPGMAFQSTSSHFRRRRPSVVDYTDYMVEMLSRGARFSVDEVPGYQARVDFDNDQDVLTQEFKVTGHDDAPVRWVGGLFLQRARQDAVEYIHEPLLNEALQVLTGQNAVAYFGSDLLEEGISYIGKDRSVDWQVAVFGQADIPLRPDVELTLGGRFGWTRYSQTNFQDGPQSGVVPPSVIKHGETPILPHVGLNWRPASAHLFYITAAKGARIGGGNAPVSTKRCANQLEAFGLDRVPERFASDSIWNYEMGAKLEIPGVRGAIQAAAYHFRWNDIQQSYSLRCLFRFTGNNARARGEGVELMFDMNPVPGLTLTLTGSYTRARYTQTTYGGVVDQTSGERAVVIPEGQALPSPSWRISGLLRYQWRVSGDVSAYVVGSGDYSSAYEQGYGPGSVDHDPETFVSPAITAFRLEAGLTRSNWGVAIFCDNILDSRDVLQKSHNNRISINMRYVIVQPRSLGVKFTYNMN